MDYYQKNATEYYKRTVAADMSECIDKFLAYVPDGGAILDAGCGSGRDSKVLLERGHQITAFDASKELARLASDHIGLEVKAMSFGDMEWDGEFDGVWACASLLHLDEAELPLALSNIHRALKPGGAFYTSFKYGTGIRQTDERIFYDYKEETLSKMIEDSGLFDVQEIFVTGDVLPGREDQRWVNVIARRACGKHNKHTIIR